MAEYQTVHFLYKDANEAIHDDTTTKSDLPSCSEPTEALAAKTNDDHPKPKNVSTKVWERFQNLGQRADAISRRSREKRIKHLQKTVIERVQNELTSDEDRDILREHDVKFGPPVHTEKDRTAQDDQTTSGITAGSSDSTSSGGRTWVEIKQYLDVNSHLLAQDRSSHAPKSGLEKQIDGAIKTGDVKLAEELSNRLSTREFGVKIAGAVAASDFVKRKKEEEEQGQHKKKKKLPWGFDQKQRWETKGNM